MSTIVVIPSHGRATSQHTARAIHEESPFPVHVVCSHGQKRVYEEARVSDELFLHETPALVRSIGQKRQWIMDKFNKPTKILMLDDDLCFSVRRRDDPTKGRKPEPGDIRRMLFAWEQALDSYAHAGILPRQGFNTKPDAALIPLQRMFRALGYNMVKFRPTKVRFDRLDCMEDFDVTLSLIAAGLPNALLGRYMQDDAGGSGAAGGCADTRRLEFQAEAAWNLAELHKPFVKVEERTTKTAWGGATRTDVRIYWQKAAKAAGIRL